VLDNWPVAIEKYEDGITDGLLVVATDRAKESGSLYTHPLSGTAPTIFARNGSQFKFTSEKDLIGKKVSVIRNTFVVEKAFRPYRDQIEIVETDNALEMLKLVLEGKVDAAFGLSFHGFYISKYFLSGIEPVYYASNFETRGVTSIRPDWPELVSIINKGIAEIGEARLNQIHTKWIGTHLTKTIAFSEREEAWLSQNPTIRVQITDYPPFTFYDKDGTPTGMAVDYFKLISEKTGLDFEYYKSNKTFPQALDGLIKHQGPDILPLIVKTADRENSILFTNEYQ
jgi:ABC-type amino acid transport substrate-binding protein